MWNIQRRTVDADPATLAAPRHSPWVRGVRRRFAERPAAAAVAPLARAAFADPDLTDAYRIARAPGTPDDPRSWADAVFRDPPRWVAALLGLRNELVRFVRIPRGTTHAFDIITAAGDEVLLGQDDEHLDFRASIVVGATTVTLSTVAKVNNRRGAAYLTVIRVVHPAIVRAMLARAARRLADAGTPSIP